MNKFLSKKITNNLREKKNKLRKIAIMLIATITFTTLGSNFVQAKESGIYNRDVICANTDPSALDAVQRHRDIYKSTKLDSFVVEEDAFTRTTKLKNVTIGNKVNFIGRDAFRGTGLANMAIPSNVETIDWGAFRYSNSITFENSNKLGFSNSEPRSVKPTLKNSSYLLVSSFFSSVSRPLDIDKAVEF